MAVSTLFWNNSQTKHQGNALLLILQIKVLENQCRMNMWKKRKKKKKKKIIGTREKVDCKDGWMFLNKRHTLICLETTTNKQTNKIF